MPSFDSRPAEIIYRISDPFDTFSYKDIEEGVIVCLGHDQKTDKWIVASVHFDRSKYSLEDARQWIQTHPDIADKTAKQKTGKKQTAFELRIPLSKSIGEPESDHFYIFGDASVVMIDNEGDRISTEALKSGLPQLLRRKRLSLVHTDIIVGEILDELEHEGKTYRTEIRDNSLTVVGNVWGDSKKSKETREGILNGKYNSYSISGEALESGVICDKEQCWNQINKMDLSAVAICEEGMNPSAKFTVLKSLGDFDFETPTDLSDNEGEIEMKKDDEKENEPNAESGDTKQDDETPASPDEAQEQEQIENTVLEELKNLKAEIESLKMRIDAIEQSAAEKQNPDEEPEEEEEEEEEKTDKKTDEKSDKTENKPDQDLPEKKTLAKNAGGSQCDTTQSTGDWIECGKMVTERGGLNKVFKK